MIISKIEVEGQEKLMITCKLESIRFFITGNQIESIYKIPAVLQKSAKEISLNSKNMNVLGCIERIKQAGYIN